LISAHLAGLDCFYHLAAELGLIQDAIKTRISGGLASDMEPSSPESTELQKQFPS
jgi:hypothetical protein